MNANKEIQIAILKKENEQLRNCLSEMFVKANQHEGDLRTIYEKSIYHSHFESIE